MKITRDWIIKTIIRCSSHMFTRMMAEWANRVDLLLHLVLSSPRNLCIRLTAASVFTSRINSCLRAINGRPRTIMTFTHSFFALDYFHATHSFIPTGRCQAVRHNKEPVANCFVFLFLLKYFVCLFISFRRKNVFFFRFNIHYESRLA